MEFATEGPRFFDLVRWGMAEKTLNAYIAVEKVNRTFLAPLNLLQAEMNTSQYRNLKLLLKMDYTNRILDTNFIASIILRVICNTKNSL